MPEIQSMHWSTTQARKDGYIRTPVDMSRVNLPREHMERLQNIAIRIFTDCVNAGTTFQDAILACYVSGIEHGVSGYEKNLERTENG